MKMYLTGVLLLLFALPGCEEDEHFYQEKEPANKEITTTFSENILLTDSLYFTTKGTQIGELEFLHDSGIRSFGGQIVYDAGKLLQNGSFEVKMKGWTAPAQGIEKSHPISGWENKDQYTHYSQKGSFWNWRIGEGYEPFKVLAAPMGIDTRQELRVGSLSMVNEKGTDVWHDYKVTWKNGKVDFFLDGVHIGYFKFNRFVSRYFLIGKDSQYGISNPAPVISQVKISEFVK
jgi:hypothetical protein